MRFELGQRLGSGGMGVVFEARDTRSGATFALKTLRELDPRLVLALKTEFRALQDVTHPNLVRFYDLVEEDGRLLLTMELVRGAVDFIRWLRPADPAVESVPTRNSRDEGVLPRPASREVGFDERRLRDAFAQLARGLSALHAARKVHRDLKPSNVLVGEEGRVVILDFGLVATRDEQRPGRYASGTVAYMSPEQARGEAAGAAADWYSVGVLLFEALTGTLPFVGADADEVIARKSEPGPPPRPRELVPGTPADLDALCAELLDQDPARRPGGPAVLARLGVRAGAGELAEGSLDVFVGREAELAALWEAFERGATTSVLVEGESGIGKSALVHHFLDELVASRPGTLVVRGRCYEREAVPFKAFDGIVDELSRLLAARDPEELAALLPPRVGLIAHAFPVMTAVPGAAARTEGTLDPQQQRPLLFQAVRALFARLAERGRVVAFIDDLHWTDSDSMALLAELLRPPGAPRLLLVATVRAEEGGAARWAAELPGEVRRLSLARLSSEAAHELAGALAAGASDADAEAAVREAEGHPFFLAELLRHRRGGAGGLRLDDALWARVGALDPPERSLMALVALAGVPIAQEVAAGAAGLAVDAHSRALAALRAAKLVRAVGGGEIEPYHDRVREAVAARVPARERIEDHARLAAALERAGGADPELLARHWAEAGEAERAAGYAVSAAERAAAALAFDRAAEHYRFALEQAPGFAAARRLRLRRAEALATAGRSGEAAPLFLAEAETVAGAEALDLRRRASEEFLKAGRIDDGIAVLAEVLERYKTRMPATKAGAIASILWSRARLRLRGLEFRQRAASELPAEELIWLDAHWAASSTLGLVDMFRGKVLSGRYLLRALDAGEPARLVKALLIEAIFRASIDGPPGGKEALRLLAVMERLSDAEGDPFLRGLTLEGRMLVAYLQGRWREATEIGARANAVLRDECVGVAWELGINQNWLNGALAYRGEIAELTRTIPVIIREAIERGDLYAATNFRVGYGTLRWLAADQPDRLHEDVGDAIRLWSGRGFLFQHFYEMHARCQADLYKGDAEAAYRRVREGLPALARARITTIEIVRVTVQLLAGRCAIAAARAAPPREARALYAEAGRCARRVEKDTLAWAHAGALLLRAALARAAGDEPQVMRLLGAAADGFARADMALHAHTARAVLAGCEGRRDAGADAWFEAQGVVRPDRMMAMVAPGVLGEDGSWSR